MHIIKKIYIIIIIFICFLFKIDNISAEEVYNAQAGTAFNGGSKGNCGTKKNCLLNNNGKVIIQARLYYVEGGNFSPIGETIYFVNSSANDYLKNKGLNLININLPKNDYTTASDILKNYITKNGKSLLETITGRKNYSEILDKTSYSYNKNKTALMGYRIIIEPAFIYANPTFSNKTHALITPKGLAAEYIRTNFEISCLSASNNCDKPLIGPDSQAQYMFVKNEDVGIGVFEKKYCENIKSEQLADIKIGCGYNIIDINEFIEPQDCYTIESLKQSDLTCINTGMNNEENLTETYKNIGVCNTSERNLYNKYGKNMSKNYNSTCNIYCIESAYISLPGNVSSPIQRGSYFAWPTKPDDIFGKYSMSIKSTMKCSIKDYGTKSETIGSTITLKCPNNYSSYSLESCRSKTEKTSSKCDSGYVEKNGSCYKLTNKVENTTTYNCCNSGYDTGSGCTYTTQYSPTTCPSGFYYNGSCYSYSKITWSTPYDCVGNHRDGYAVPTSYCITYVGYKGASSMCCSQSLSDKPTCSSSYYKYGSYCYQKREYDTCTNKTYTCPSGYEVYSENTSKCISITSEPKTDCPSGYKYFEKLGACYKVKQKNVVNYSCPSGYTISADKTTCNKVCNEDNLIKTVEAVIKNNTTNKISAKITGGTNKKIDEDLDIASDTYSFDRNTLTFERIVTFKIPNNKNRYYNKITEDVTDREKSSQNTFDRGQGVISLSKSDPIYFNNKLIDYSLKISNIKVGTNNQFGQLLDNVNYTCKYNIIEDTRDCICPSGTKNAGMVIDDIIEKYCDEVNKTCADWKYELCDSDYSKITEIEGCTNKFYCVNPDTKKDVDITECVKDKAKTNDLVTAEKICKLNKKECTNDTKCINPVTKQTGDITQCLKDGNSREFCEIKAGCSEDSYCTGSCKWIDQNIKSVTYAYQKCNNKYCGFKVYCTEENKITSSASYDCIEKELGVNDIEKALNNGISINKLKTAVDSCKTTICATNEKIIYRVIDLNNPFSGNQKNRNESNFSNSDLRSRTPGSNWNSKNVVYNEILNARGKEGYKLYTEKEPIIKITLTPSDIKAIRNYNKNNSYDNFKLNCVEKNESGCISEFLHDNKLGLKIEAVNNCKNLNKNSSLKEFNKCYNSNN